MRIILALPLLAAAAACNVDNDAANDQMTIEFNQERLEDAASDVGNVAEDAGNAIGNEIDDLDVDVDVSRNGSGNSS